MSQADNKKEILRLLAKIQTRAEVIVDLKSRNKRDTDQLTKLEKASEIPE